MTTLAVPSDLAAPTPLERLRLAARSTLAAYRCGDDLAAFLAALGELEAALAALDQTRAH
jgi:hypothetical protein